jgi:putative ABC transport system permease protein
MDTLLQDLRYAARRLGGSPGLTAAMVLVLGLGMGLNATLFTLIDATLLRPMPGVDGDRLVWLNTQWRRGLAGFSYSDFLAYRDAGAPVFSDVMAYSPVPLSVAGEPPERLRGHAATASYFAVLGVSPAQGRFFHAEEDRAEDAAVVVLGHGLWQRRFGGEAGVVGRTLAINGRAFTIVGIAPEGFVGPELGGTDLWVPFGPSAQTVPGRPPFRTERASWLHVLARRRPGITTAQAQGALEGTAVERASDRPEDDRYLGVLVSAARGGLPPPQRGEGQAMAALVLAMSLLLLVIACANVANLFLARGLGRAREMAVRLSLGAVRARLVRQLVTESLALSALGAAVGVTIAAWAVPVSLAVLPRADFQGMATRPGLRTFAFTAATCVLTALAFGLIPALQSTRPDVVQALKVDGPAVGARRSRFQAAFMVAQFALAAVLMLAGGSLLRAIRTATALDLGFDPGGVATASFDLTLQGYAAERTEGFRRQVLERVAAEPGVTAAALTNLAPMGGTLVGRRVHRPGQTDGGLHVYVNGISPGYFRTLRIPLQKGRDFTGADRSTAAGVAIVNEALARRLWPDKEPLGERLSLSGPAGPFLEVVGVARNAVYDEPGESPRPFAYVPLAQRAVLARTAVLVRTDGDAGRAAEALRRTLRSLAPDLPVFEVATLDGIVADRMDKERHIGALLGAMAAAGLALAAIGLFGVTAHAATRRTREMGVRVALGAGRAHVMALVVGQTMRVALIGTVLGSMAGVPATFLLSRLFIGVRGADFVIAFGVAALLLLVGLAAAFLPARRAASLEAMTALRYE